MALHAAPLARLPVRRDNAIASTEARLAAAAHAVDAVGALGEHGLVLGCSAADCSERHGRHDLVRQRRARGAADALAPSCV